MYVTLNVIFDEKYALYDITWLTENSSQVKNDFLTIIDVVRCNALDTEDHRSD